MRFVWFHVDAVNITWYTYICVDRVLNELDMKSSYMTIVLISLKNIDSQYSISDHAGHNLYTFTGKSNLRHQMINTDKTSKMSCVRILVMMFVLKISPNFRYNTKLNVTALKLKAMISQAWFTFELLMLQHDNLTSNYKYHLRMVITVRAGKHS